jgi:hypothetical protein
MHKPAMFVGSSTEGLDFARAVRSLLKDDADITLWNEGFFALGSTFIETLINNLPAFDFAVLILTPDDLITRGENTALSPRDNLIFEAGLFMGRLGRARTVILHADVKIPSDLAGTTTARFEWTGDFAKRTQAVAPACDSIRQIIRTLGVAESKAAAAIERLASRQDQQAHELAEQSREIRTMRMVLKGIVTRYEFDKLSGLDRAGPFLCYYSDDLYHEMKRLRAMGLVDNHAGVGLRDIQRDYRDRSQQFDLKRYFLITNEGRDYLRLRLTFEDE